MHPDDTLLTPERLAAHIVDSLRDAHLVAPENVTDAVRVVSWELSAQVGMKRVRLAGSSDQASRAEG